MRVRPLLALHRGRMAALTRVLPILRAARTSLDPLVAVDQVRAALAAMPVAADAVAVAAVAGLVPGPPASPGDDLGAAVSVGSQNVRARLLADIDRLRPTLTPPEARQWLDEALSACEAWMARLQALFPTRP